MISTKRGDELEGSATTGGARGGGSLLGVILGLCFASYAFASDPASTVSVDDDPVLGPSSAPVTIIEFADYQCPFSGRVEATLKQLREKYGDRVRIVFRDYPLSFHPLAQGAAEAAGCALEQGKFWEMHGAIFLNQGLLREVDLEERARRIGLDVGAFRNCVSSGSRKGEIKKDIDDGVAVGVTGTPAFFINGKFLSGAQPLENFAKGVDEALAGGGSPTRDSFAVVGQPSRQPPPPARTATRISVDDDPARGDSSAPVTIIEFADYQCPFCARAEATLQKIRANYGDRVRIVFRDFPLSFHQNAQKAAEAAGCAQEQGKFWEMQDLLFANQSKLLTEDMKGYARSIGLDLRAFASCLDTGARTSEVEKDVKDAGAAGVSGTPAFFINGEFSSGAKPYEEFAKIIDAQLARAHGPSPSTFEIVSDTPPGLTGGGAAAAVVAPTPERLPARLTARLHWEGEKPFRDGALDAEEKGTILLDLTNEGEGTAEGITVKVTPDSLPGVSFPSSLNVARVGAGKTETLEIPFAATLDVADGRTEFKFQASESHGHDANRVDFPLFTRAVLPPKLALLEDFDVTGSFQGREVPRDVVATIRLRVQNSGSGPARGVTARITPGKDVSPAGGTQDSLTLGDLAPGEAKLIEYRCYANQRAEEMTLRVDLEESRSRFSVPAVKVTIPLEGSSKPAQVVQFQPDERKAVEPVPAPSPLSADVDREIPRASTKRPSGLAVIFGVEDYASGPRAQYALSDAATARTYFERLLGIPPEQILVLRDREVTLGQFGKVFGENGWLARRTHPDSEVFVFFSGHGMAELEGKSPYLMPSDADMNYVVDTGFPVDRMVERLGALRARAVTVFLDACFSGVNRDGTALQSGGRPMAIAVRPVRAAGVSIFSAAKGTQIASGMDDQKHGIFSYQLFKGLAGAADLNKDRVITGAELKEYLEASVPREAARRDREQSPDILLADPTAKLVELK